MLLGHVYLLFGNVYLNRRSQSAYLGERLDRRKVAPVCPVESFLVIVGLLGGQVRYVLDIDTFKKLHL